MSGHSQQLALEGLLILPDKYRLPFPAAIPPRAWENSRVAHVNTIPSPSAKRNWSDKIMTMNTAKGGSVINELRNKVTKAVVA